MKKTDEQLDKMLFFLYQRQPEFTFRVRKGYKANTMKTKNLWIKITAPALAVVLVLSGMIFSRQLIKGENSFMIIANAESASPDEVTKDNAVTLDDNLMWEPIVIGGGNRLFATVGFNIRIDGNNIDTVTYKVNGADFLIQDYLPDIVEKVPAEPKEIKPFKTGYAYIDRFIDEEMDYSDRFVSDYSAYSSYTVSFDHQPKFSNSEYPEITENPLLSPIGLEIFSSAYTDDFTAQKLNEFFELEEREQQLEEELGVPDDKETALPGEVQECLKKARQITDEIYVHILEGVTVDITANFKDGTDETKTVSILPLLNDEGFVSKYELKIVD